VEKFAAEGATTGDAVGFAWTAATGRATGGAGAGWIWTGVMLPFVFVRGRFWEGIDCRVPGAATGADGAPDCPLGTDVALVAGLGLRSNPLPDLWAIANKGAIARIRAAVFAILIQKAFLKNPDFFPCIVPLRRPVDH
jgi:hypothetical protein